MLASILTFIEHYWFNHTWSSKVNMIRLIQIIGCDYRLSCLPWLFISFVIIRLNYIFYGNSFYGIEIKFLKTLYGNIGYHVRLIASFLIGQTISFLGSIWQFAVITWNGSFCTMAWHLLVHHPGDALRYFHCFQSEQMHLTWAKLMLLILCVVQIDFEDSTLVKIRNMSSLSAKASYLFCLCLRRGCWD